MTATDRRLKIGEYYPASKDAQRAVLELPIQTEDGRSPWQWITLSDGTLFFGCLPQGDGYFGVEGHFSDEWVKARAKGKLRPITADLDNDFPDLEPQTYQRPTPPPANSPEFVAARQAAAKADDALRHALHAEVRQLMPNGIHAVTFCINDTPRLTVSGMIDDCGDDVLAQHELTAAYDLIDGAALETGVTNWDDAASFLETHSGGHEEFIIHREDSK